MDSTPDAGSTPWGGEVDLVRRDVAAALLADPGVLRLEPTLATMVRAWSTAPAPEELVRVTTTDGAVDVAVHLAVQGEEARLVAHRARAVVRRLVVEHGHVPGSVEVSVLTVEPAEVPETVG
jgi:hypothetical protein